MTFAPSQMEVTSDAFAMHAAIPQRYTGEGANVSPALAWRHVPEGTRGYAVICHDPDAPLVTRGTYGFVHWVLYNLPASLAGLAEASDRGTAGANDGGGTGYTGPMPPNGDGLHQYYFWVLALDQELELAPGITLNELLEAVDPHLLGMNRLVGGYERT